MAMLIVQRVSVVLVLLLLVFNMSQRGHLHHGERKRFASLYAAGFALAFYAMTFVFQRLGVPPLYLLLVLGVEAGIAFRLRKKIFIFRTSCDACGRRLPFRQVLFVDLALCEECAQDAHAVVSPEETTRTIRRVDEVDWEAWIPAETAVLCFIRDGERLMLIEKKRGLGAGKVNGPGGRIEEGESPAEAALREVEEEIHLRATALSQRAELSFIFTDGYSLRCFVFLAEGYSGSPEETDEAVPFWCKIEEIPFNRMWADDRLWLPKVLAGEYVIGRFIFDGDAMLSSDIIAQ
ncbi:MAG TPA: 8-oxo-dGTP diphosphatase [Spirochaetia bacterium]|nr:8-oxo-dGTP diphosphatase [Spirochaetia bacterium]